MRSHILSAKEFRKNIFKALDDIEENLTPYILTKKGEPKAVVMSLVELEALMETYDVLNDPDLMNQIKHYKKNKRKNLLDWEKVKKTLL